MRVLLVFVFVMLSVVLIASNTTAVSCDPPPPPGNNVCFVYIEEGQIKKEWTTISTLYSRPYYKSYPISHYCDGGYFKVSTEPHLVEIHCPDGSTEVKDCTRLTWHPSSPKDSECVRAEISSDGNYFYCWNNAQGTTCSILGHEGKCATGNCCARVGDVDDLYTKGSVVWYSDEHPVTVEDSCTDDGSMIFKWECRYERFGEAYATGQQCPEGYSCSDGACVEGGAPGGGGGGIDNGTGGGNQTPGLTPTELCSVLGETRCVGLALQVCMDSDGDGQGEWVTTQSPAEECCEDGDCSQARCLQFSGSWLPIAPSPDFAQTGYCCGDDGINDLGWRFDNYLCVDDGGYRWVLGENATRYVGNRILFCNGDFHICYNEDPYYLVNVVDHCTNMCGYYCEPAFDKWLSDTQPEGLDILSEPLGEGERIDSKKYDLDGGYGCCPSMWCWNGASCIENQIDESGNLYVYTPESSSLDYRCQDGSWTEAELVYNWDYTLKGYCPDKDAQCLVSYDNYTSNNQPEKYFSDEKPQCISDGQWILDYYCHGNEWVSRTSLVATKMLELVGAGTGTRFKLFCDSYDVALNDYSYSVLGKPVASYFERNCELNGYSFSCANNVCVLQNLDTGEVMFGTSLNVDLFDSSYGLAQALGLSNCGNLGSVGAWDYRQCTSDAIYNSNINTIIYSPTGVAAVQALSAWDFFIAFIKNPIQTISDLVLTGQIRYYGITGIPLRFDILNTSKLFSKLYIADLEDGKLVQGVYETGKFDWNASKMKYYLLVKYEGFDQDICRYVNNYTVAFGRLNCEEHNGRYIVLDSRDMPSYLMEHWLDLTSKFS